MAGAANGVLTGMTGSFVVPGVMFLQALGLPADSYVPALVGFNVGVELGQFAVIGLALVVVGWARDRAFYRRVVVIPGSVLIGSVGLYWAVERALGG